MQRSNNLLRVLCRFHHPLLLVSLTFAALAGSASAQASPSAGALPKCSRGDFSTSLQFRDGPSATYTIVIFRRSITAHTCVLEDSSDSIPTFDIEGLEGRADAVRFCYPCEYREPNGMYQVHPTSVTVAPGAVVTQNVRWKTEPGRPDTACVKPKWIGGPIMVVAPEQLKPICSEIQVSWFSRGEPDTLPPFSNEQPAFEITTAKKSYYGGEGFYIHVKVLDQNLQPNLREDCPVLELRQLSPHGETRTDEAGPTAFAGCRRRLVGVEGGKGGDWQNGFDLYAWLAEPGEHEFEVLQFTGKTPDGIQQFAFSNALKVQVLDPASRNREWKGRDHGVWVDLTLDKSTYRVGEDIPLHVAIQNHDAEVPIYSMSSSWDPPIVAVEVLDLLGRPLPAAARFESFFSWGGHGRGPIPYEKAKIETAEFSLREIGWLPKTPGDYLIVATWAVSTGPESAEGLSIRQLYQQVKPYVTVRAAAPIHIEP